MKKRSMIYYIYFYGNVIDEINITAQFMNSASILYYKSCNFIDRWKRFKINLT